MNLIVLDNVPTVAPAKIIVISGTLDASVGSLEIGTTLADLAPVPIANQRFQTVLELDVGHNEFILQPYSITASPLAPDRISIEYVENKVELLNVGNSLDFHGAEIGFDRLRGEKNVSYKARLLQGAKRQGAGRDFIPISYATELAFPISIGMLRVYADRSTFNTPLVTNPFIRVTLDELQLAADEIISSEVVVFDEQYPYVTPADPVSPFGVIRLLEENGQELDPSCYDYDTVSNRIRLLDAGSIGKDLILEYNSITAFALSTDIAALVTAVNASNLILIEVFDSEYHDDTVDSLWILPRQWTSLSTREDFPTTGFGDNPGVYLSVSELKTYVLHEFKDDLLINGSGIGTKLEKYVNEILQAEHRSWDRFVVGRDGLRDENIVPLYDSFPHLTDPVRGTWSFYADVSAVWTLIGSRLNIHQIAYLTTIYDDYQIVFNGVHPEEWQSGTGTLGDLSPGIASQELRSYGDIIEEQKTPSSLYGVL